MTIPGLEFLALNCLAQGAFTAYRAKARGRDYHGDQFPDWFGIDSIRRGYWRETMTAGLVLFADGERDVGILAPAIFAAYARASGGVDRFGNKLEPWDAMKDETRENWTAAAAYILEALSAAA